VRSLSIRATLLELTLTGYENEPSTLKSSDWALAVADKAVVKARAKRVGNNEELDRVFMRIFSFASLG
jgi:hypothetical protein